MISLIGFMILRFFVLILEIVKYKKLITSFFLRFCALLRFCTWRNGKTIRKTSFSCGHCSMCCPLRGGVHGKSIAKAMKASDTRKRFIMFFFLSDSWFHIPSI